MYTTSPTPGQIAYNQDVALRPTYHDGQQRRTWEQLEPIAKWSWERNEPIREKGNK